MATKAKTVGSASSTSVKATLEDLFSEALNLVNQKKHDEAVSILEKVEAQALELGKVGMVRSARCYLTAIKARKVKDDDAAGKPELIAQLHLNRGEDDEALVVLEKALAKHAHDARLLYLKATALSHKEQAEPAAEALRQALQANEDLIHQYRLERDFDRMRSTAPFAAFERD